ncbi:glycosyltransferase family 39 protein [Chryseobacterium sp. H1D6B]|uniref:glycosyltransferase family 39 protein n=1 Tax=Chryseobacterium sp. H1D6B TaxID=2940588 RepID=UPI00182E7DEC
MLCFILLKFSIHYFLIAPDYDLQRDEFLHLDQANHLAWGYTSVPPVTSWISFLTKILGNSIFWIKFFPALFGALTIVIVWKAIEEIKGNLFALVLGATCITFSALFRVNMLYQPNSLDILCWTALYYFVLKYVNSYQIKWLYITAVIFAIGFLNKYNIAFLILGILPAVILTSERRVFKNKHLYFAGGLVLLLIFPNLIWQFNNDLPVIHHFNELSETQLQHVKRWNFILAQFLFFPGSFLVILIGLYALLKDERLKKYGLFLLSFFTTLGIFLLLQAKDYYAIGIYPIYFAFGSVYISKITTNKYASVIRPVLVICIIILFIPTFNVSFPNRSPQYITEHQEKYRAFGMLTWEDGKEHELPQDFADMLGWKELAEKVDRTYHSIPNKKNTLVLCDNYGQAGAINYYSKSGIRAVSFSADYIDWFDFSIDHQNLIRVTGALEKDSEWKKTSPAFHKSIVVDSVTKPYARERGTAILVFMGAKININEVLKTEINKIKSSY